MKKIKQNKQSNLLFFVCAGLLFIISVFVVIKEFQAKPVIKVKNNIKPSILTQTPRIKVSTDVSTWKTYNNESLRGDSFSFKYPAEWTYKDSIFENGFLLLGEKDNIDTSPKVKVRVSSVWPQISLDLHIEDLQLDPKIENISVGTIKAKQLTYSKSESKDCLTIIFKVKNWLYQFDIEDSTRENNKEVLLKILSTFELIPSGLKKYTDPKNRVTFLYPSEYIVDQTGFSFIAGDKEFRFIIDNIPPDQVVPSIKTKLTQEINGNIWYVVPLEATYTYCDAGICGKTLAVYYIYRQESLYMFMYSTREMQSVIEKILTSVTFSK